MLNTLSLKNYPILNRTQKEILSKRDEEYDEEYDEKSKRLLNQLENEGLFLKDKVKLKSSIFYWKTFQIVYQNI